MESSLLTNTYELFSTDHCPICISIETAIDTPRWAVKIDRLDTNGTTSLFQILEVYCTIRCKALKIHVSVIYAKCNFDVHYLILTYEDKNKNTVLYVPNEEESCFKLFSSINDNINRKTS